MVEDVSVVTAALHRGQAVVFNCFGEEPLSQSQAELARGLRASKLIFLYGGGVDLVGGAIRAADVELENEPLSLLQRAASACVQKIPRVHILSLIPTPIGFIRMIMKIQIAPMDIQDCLFMNLYFHLKKNHVFLLMI
jgi:hypothetical protein